MVRRSRPRACASALPQDVGTTPTTPGTCCSACASSSVSGRTEVGNPLGAPPRAVERPGEMPTTLVPNCENSPSTKRWMPSPIEVSRITAAMPTAMPASVRKLRVRCALIERQA